MSNPYKVSGPEVTYVIAEAQCCRVWPVISATLTWTEDIDGWKRELWGWRRCGYCGMQPTMIVDGDNF